MSTDPPWELVMVIIALNFLLGAAVSSLCSARKAPGIPAVKQNETTKHVQGGQTSTEPGGNFARCTWVIRLAGGRGVEVNDWKDKKAWLMSGRVRFLQDILEEFTC